MINFLFGWLLKPRFEVTILDGLVSVVEFIILFVLIVFIVTGFSVIREKIKERKNK